MSLSNLGQGAISAKVNSPICYRIEQEYPQTKWWYKYWNQGLPLHGIIKLTVSHAESVCKFYIAWYKLVVDLRSSLTVVVIKESGPSKA